MAQSHLSDLTARLEREVLLIDGGLSTACEELGAQVKDSLWTARLLLDAPEVVVAAHEAFIRAGASVVATASYQVSELGFSEAGLGEGEVERALLASVRCAREANLGTGGSALVAASVGPYGAVLADGSEYRGNYGLTHEELVSFHEPRVLQLIAAKPDLIAFETIPDLAELQAITEVCERVATVSEPMSVWVSLSCESGARLCSGEAIEQGVTVLGDLPGLIAIGANCAGVATISEALGTIRSVTDLPMVAYPNGGGAWDAQANCWVGATDPITDEVLHIWIAEGVRLIGGCCGYGPGRLAELKAQLGRVVGAEG
jgi:homocysteine S-methyltransferase